MDADMSLPLLGTYGRFGPIRAESSLAEPVYGPSLPSFHVIQASLSGCGSVMKSLR